MTSSNWREPEGWLQDPDHYWLLRFHRDPKSWTRFPFMFMDKGRSMKDGSPPLLKSRKHIPKCDAVEIWKKLLKKGWIKVDPQWGVEDP